MELVSAIIFLVGFVGLLICLVIWVIDEIKKQKQRDEWLKSIADDVAFITSESVKYDEKK